MNNLFFLGYNVLLSKISRIINYPLNKPFSVFYSLTNECYSRCKTCNIWKLYKKNPYLISKELSFDEWKKTIIKIGGAPYWVSITGGEPLLKKKFSKLIDLMIEHHKPRYLAIATSGIYPKKTQVLIKKVLEKAKKNKVIVFLNVSIDGLGKEYKKIRGIDSFAKVKKTIFLLKKLKDKYPNFVLGINLTLSDYTNLNFKKTYSKIMNDLVPDSFISEVVGNKYSLYYKKSKINVELTLKNVQFLLEKNNQQTKNSKIVSFFRKKYYNLVRKHLLLSKEIIKCYSGYSFFYIDPYGKVRPCSIRKEIYGDLKKNMFDINEVITSQRAKKTRILIKKEKCFCNDTGANYLNLLCN